VTRQPSGIPGQQVELPRTWNRFGPLRRRRTARLEADFLDNLVDTELAFMRQLPGHLRGGPTDALAVLVMLAQDYRHYAQGWINRRELRLRTERALADLDVLRQVPGGEPLSANRID
jgi:hypothetical protein